MAGQFDALIRRADDHLILGHRLSEWCGHAPMLEEDLALPNIALDLIGQARALYQYAAEVEAKGRTEDDLAYLRLERDYRNMLICERPNGDFGHTILRQFYFSALMVEYWTVAQTSTDAQIAAIAAKAIKESRYHLRHTAEWVIRLGDGTEESHNRMIAAAEDLAPYVGELFEPEPESASLGLPDPAALRDAWVSTVQPVLIEATLPPQIDSFAISGGRRGQHTEDMGYLLAELQSVQRAYPGLTW